MPPANDQEATFGLIEAIILRLFRKSNVPVTHDAIAAAYLHDDVARPLLVRRQGSLPEPHTLEWLASNDVAWFSARISRREWPIEGRFIRSRVNGKWAYAPAHSAT